MYLSFASFAFWQYGVTREECDEYAMRSQMLWGLGQSNGAFTEEMAPIEVKTKKGPKVCPSPFPHPFRVSREKKLFTPNFCVLLLALCRP